MSRAMMLDGAAEELVKFASTETIRIAADGLDAIAAAAREWLDARRELDEAEAGVRRLGDAEAAAIKQTADALHKEGKDRHDADMRHGDEVVACMTEMSAKLHANRYATRPYATGAARLDETTTYCESAVNPCVAFTPEVTDENRDYIANFKPVLRRVPDTAKITLETPAITAAFSAVDKARRRFADAARTLSNAIDASKEPLAELADAAEAEGISVAKAVAIQTERNAANGR